MMGWHRTEHVLLLWIVLLRCTDVIDTAAPVVSSLPTDIYVGDLETGSRILYTYTIQDPDGDTYTCVNTITAELAGAAVAGTYDELELQINSGNTELWSTGLTTFDAAAVDKYYNSIVCTDTNSEPSTGLIVNVIVLANELLTNNNLEGSGNSLPLNALATGQAVLVKTVDSTSSNGGYWIQYTMVNDPSSSPEYFTMDLSTGGITTNRQLQSIDANTPSMSLIITAYDLATKLKVYSTQTVLFTNQNTIPDTTNMKTGLADSQAESLASGTLLFTVSTEDPDASQSHTYRYTTTQTAMEDTFTLDSNGNFMLATDMSLNYEIITFYNFSFYVSDGVHEGGPFVYELTVVNVNEAPSFSVTMYYVSTTEATTGSVSFDPGFTCTDPDVGDSVTYLFQTVSPSELFTISSSGVLSFNVDYDVDQNAMPSSVILTVYCIDSGTIDGTTKTGTAQVTITIADDNDNTPTFTAGSYTLTVDQNVTPGSIIGIITPTDDDSGTNAYVTCSWASDSIYSNYYSFGANCNIYLTKQIDFASTTQVTYIASATDGGSPQLTGTATVFIIYQAAATTTIAVTTTTGKNFFDDAGNIILFVFALLLGLALLGLVTWFILRTWFPSVFAGSRLCRSFIDCKCFGRRNRRYPQRLSTTPETPPQSYRRDIRSTERVNRPMKDYRPAERPPRPHGVRPPQIRPSPYSRPGQAYPGYI